jgi:hypothetical protein
MTSGEQEKLTAPQIVERLVVWTWIYKIKELLELNDRYRIDLKFC